MLSMRPKILALACEMSPTTGEGYLARSLIDLMQSSFEVSVYTDSFMRLLYRHTFARDRLLPVYIFFLCLGLRLVGTRVVLLNYMPIWNFLNAFLARVGVFLGPITGSALISPARPRWLQRISRVYVQKLFIFLTSKLLPSRRLYWCATPSVFRVLGCSGFKKLYLGFPYLSSIRPAERAVGSAEFDIFIYSGRHTIKNHTAAYGWINRNVDDFRVCYVGPDLNLPHSKLVAFNTVPEERFNELLSCSALYLSFSFEDAGITGMKALAFGVPVLCPHQSGLAYAVEYRTENCYVDPFDFADITRLVRNILSEQSDPDSYRQRFIDLKGKSNKAATAWLESMKSS